MYNNEQTNNQGLAVRGQDNVAKALLFVPHHVRAQWANAYQVRSNPAWGRRMMT